MKKFALVCIATVMLTGCAKNYKTVDEYSTAMDRVKNSMQSYTVEIRQTTPVTTLYYKTYVKGDKWKTEMSMNGGSSYMSTTLYDGEDLMTYSSGSPYAIINSIVKEFGEDKETIKSVINSQNPANMLLNWRDGNPLLFEYGAKPEFINNKANKNSYNCRMIKFTDTREACISDRYGIAVYEKMQYENKGKTEETVLDLINIDTAELSDSTFELPEGIEKMDMSKMMDRLSSMLKFN